MDKLYQFETNRSCISAKQFYTWVSKEFKRRTGQPFEWLDDFDSWASPYHPGDHRYKDSSGFTEEICKTLPYDFQLYLKDTYNFILEWYDGHGYCYIVEFKR